MIRTAVLVQIGIVLGAATLLAMTNEPTGFGKLAFGTSIEEARKLFPTMEKTEQEKLAPIFKHPLIERFIVKNQTVEGIGKPVDVELRFWKGKFWLAVVPFGDTDPNKVVEGLAKRYGPPKSATALHHYWAGQKTAVSADIKGKWYDVHDETISEDVRQMWVSGQLRQGGVLGAGAGTTPAAAGTPAPAASTPASQTPKSDSPPPTPGS